MEELSERNDRLIVEHFDLNYRSLALSESWLILLKFFDSCAIVGIPSCTAISLKQQYYADTACTLTLTAMTSTKRHICCLILRIVTSSFLATLVHVRNSVFLRQDLRLVTYDVIKMEC